MILSSYQENRNIPQQRGSKMSTKTPLKEPYWQNDHTQHATFGINPSKGIPLSQGASKWNDQDVGAQWWITVEVLGLTCFPAIKSRLKSFYNEDWELGGPNLVFIYLSQIPWHQIKYIQGVQRKDPRASFNYV